MGHILRQSSAHSTRGSIGGRRIELVLPVFLLTALLALFTAAPIHADDLPQYDFPRWSPDGRWFSFQHDGDIWISSLSGDSLHNLTADLPDVDAAPVWSPDGTLLAFSASGEIWVMPVDGAERWSISGGVEEPVRSPRWSPDGRVIAFASQETLWRASSRSGEASRWVLGSDLPDVDHLLMGCAAWSPDGERFIFQAQLTYGGDGDSPIFVEWVVSRDGTLTGPLETDLIGCLWWGADSDSLFLQGFSVYGDPGAFIDYGRVDTLYGGWTRLTESWEAVGTVVSPDRARIAFHPVISHELTDVGGAPQFEYEYPPQIDILDTGRSRQVFPVDGAALTRQTSLAWSPDGTAVYLATACANDPAASALWRVPLDGEASSQLIDCHEGKSSQLAVSPDGGYLLFHDESDTDQALFLLDLSSGKLRQITL